MTVITRNHYLEVNSVPLSTPAYWITNLEEQLLTAADLKGGDIDIPHVTGVLANPRRVTVTKKAFAMTIIGSVDRNNSVQSDQMAGLVANVEYLTSNLGIASASGDGTVTAIWHRSDSTTKSAAVTVLGLHCSKLTDRPMLSAVLEVSLPLGVFA